MFLVRELARQQIAGREVNSWPVKGSVAVFVGLVYIALMLIHL